VAKAGIWGGLARRSLLLFVAAVPACIDTSAPLFTGRVRLVNVLTDDAQPQVDVYLDGEAFGEAIGFGQSTPAALPAPQTDIYKTLQWGGHNFTLRSTDSTIVVAQYAFGIESSDDITLYARGSGGFTAFQTLDDNRDPPAGSVRLRAVNLCGFAGSVDIFVTAPNDDIATATPVLPEALPNAPTEYFTVPAGTLRFRAVRTGVAPADRAANIVVNLNNQNWPGGGRTIVFVDDADPLGNPFCRPAAITDH
jgi:uncharacterized protein DUF4397